MVNGRRMPMIMAAPIKRPRPKARVRQSVRRARLVMDVLALTGRRPCVRRLAQVHPHRRAERGRRGRLRVRVR